VPNKFLTLIGGKPNLTPVQLQDIDGYEYNQSIGLEFTTLNSWITKSGSPFTTAIKKAGTYVVMWYAEVGHTVIAAPCGYRLQYRIGTTGTFINLTQSQNGVAVASQLDSRTGFAPILIPSDSVVQFNVQYGATTTGISAIQNSRVMMYRLA
jgi:hypothetical protein